MFESLPMFDYIVLGQLFWYLQTPHARLDEIRKHIDLFIAQLTKCSLPSTLATGGERLRSFANRQLFTDPSNRLMPTHQSELALIMEMVGNAMNHETSQHQMIALKIGEVTARLRGLPTVLKLTETQRHLLDETIRCCECEAYRAGAVMGWNLAFDFIRQWVFDNRLSDLQRGLTKACPSRSPINHYDDFFAKNPPTEYEFLDACASQDAGIIGGRLHEKLKEHLRQRNDFAHANDKMPSVSKTNTYIEHLIDIITAHPFK